MTFRTALSTLALSAFVPLCGTSADEPVPVQLAPVVTTATRVPESSATVGTDVTSVPADDLAREQLFSLADALGVVPGAPLFADGREGATASIFLRGANSNQTLFLVDGIRMNDANTDFGGFLGGGRVFPNDTLEVALGPQSTLYGAEASGGVVALGSRPGSGASTAAVAAEGGSFGSFDAMITAQGATKTWDYNLSGAVNSTDNDRINNRFEAVNLAVRIDHSLGTYVKMGATVRGFLSHYGDPSDEYTNNPYAYENERNWLGTLFLDARMTEYIDSKVTFGGQLRNYDIFDPTYVGDPTAYTQEKDRRGVIDWQNTVKMTGHNRLVAGLEADRETTVNTGFGNIDRGQNLFALYAEDEWDLPDNIFVTGGVRRDEYNTYSAETTGRLTAAWLAADKAFKLRGSYGTGFNSPSFLDLYGRDTSYVGNPDLLPEKSRGWDAGVDFYVPDQKWTLSATYFETNFENLIVDNFNATPATTENLGRARTHGVELAVKTVLAGVLQTKVAYNRLEAEDLTDGTPLLRRPHYEATADFWHEFGPRFSAGGGASWVGTRADIDARTYATIQDPGYAVARVYAAFRFNSHLSFRARIENLLDRSYEPVDGYPALGRRETAGAEWRF